jgi:DNA-binding LytR/AlgR family response regulator
MNCIIVDDDVLAAKTLKKCLERKSTLNLIGEFLDAESALVFLKENTCDILFLDMEMGEMSGLDLIRNLTKVPYVIIVSSKSEYAADAFNFDVVDYIVKPLTYSRFEQAINKIEQVSENLKPSDKEYFYIKQDNRMIQLLYKDVIYIEALADYVNIHTSDNRYTILSTMKAIESQMPPKDFMRIHRSFIVRLDKIKVIEDNSISVEGKLLTVSL